MNDTRDLPQSATASSGACASTGGPSDCTLRAAVQAANQLGGSNTINVPAGTYNLTNTTQTGTPCHASDDESIGDLKVNDCNNSTSITIVGAGEGATVIDNSLGSNGHRLFTLYPNGTLDLQKMTLENGNGTTTGTQDAADGGAVDSEGHLSAETVVFTGNATPSPSYACATGEPTDGFGGAIYAGSSSGSTVSATGGVFQNNTGYDGGAVYTDAPQDVTLGFDLLQSNSSTDSGHLFGCVNNGSPAQGGGGAVYGASGAAGLTLNFDDVAQNTANNNGGAVYWTGGGALNVTNSLFTQNSGLSQSGGSGGAIANYAPNNVNISNTSFDQNTIASTGHGGGAIWADTTNALALTQDKFTNNSTGSSHGGALWLRLGSKTTTATILSSEFDGNSANGSSSPSFGGAIFWNEGTLVLDGDSFVQNNAQCGGALYVGSAALGYPANQGQLTLVDSTLSRNTASADGGAIDLNGCYGGHADLGLPATLTNDTIAFNNAGAASGGGIDFEGGAFTSAGAAAGGFGVENTVIGENSGGDCAGNTGSNEGLTGSDEGNNLDSDQTCLGGVGGQNDKVGVNPLLSNPANNGGPAAGGPGDTETLQTDAEQASSPTMDAGDNNGCPTVDERGVTRPQGKACDIGAYEFGAQPSTSVTTTAIVTATTARTTSTATTKTKTKTKKTRKCGKGKHRSHGKCVKNKKHKKHGKKHKKAPRKKK